MILKKETIKIENLSNENIIHIIKDEIQYIQFRRLLEYKNLVHCFTLKPIDFGTNSQYTLKKDQIQSNFLRLGNEFEFDIKDICKPKQTHSDKVEIVKEDDMGIYISKFDNVDGLTTKNKNKVLMLSFADCTPLLFYDPIKKVIANTHSGWKGTYQEIGVKTIEKMKEEYNCNPYDIICCIGPHIRKCHFEVDKNVRDMFYEKFIGLERIEKIIEYNNENKKYYIDTAEINKQILMKAGLREENIIDSKICTVCKSNLCHSYRADKDISGRAVAIMELI